jgi:hypothetical protein
VIVKSVNPSPCTELATIGAVTGVGSRGLVAVVVNAVALDGPR